MIIDYLSDNAGQRGDDNGAIRYYLISSLYFDTRIAGSYLLAH